MQSKNQKIRSIYGYCLSGLLAISAICLIVGCVMIYFANPSDPFSVQTVSNAFSYIAIPIYLTIVGVVLGVVLHFAFPTEEGKLLVQRNNSLIISRLNRSAVLSSLSATDREELERLRRRRKLSYYVSVALYVLFGVLTVCVVLCFLCFEVFGVKTDAQVEANSTNSVIVSVIAILSFAVVPFGFNVYRILTEPKQLIKEIEILRSAEQVKPLEDEKSGDVSKRDMTLRYSVMSVLFIIAITFLFIGFSDGMYEVWDNAQRICTSCIGLG